MLLPDIAERQVLSSIETYKDYRSCIERNLRSDCFSVHKEAWNFISDYSERYKQPPPRNLVNAKFSDFEFITPLPISACIDDLLEIFCQSRVYKWLNQDNNIKLLQHNPRTFVDNALKEFADISREQAKHSYIIYDYNAMQMLEEYYATVERRQKSGMLGIPTGLPTLDNHIFGWQPGQLIAIVARLEIGKSWTLTYFAMHAYLDGKKILFLSPEMPGREAKFRFLTMHAYATKGYSIRNSLLVSGATIDVEQFKDYLRSVEDEQRLIIHTPGEGTVFNLAYIDDAVERWRPDILIVDGLPLIATEGNTRSGKDWREFLDASYGLKNIAMSRDIVVITSSQANREASDEATHPSITQISYGDSLAQACDLVFSLAKPRPEAIRNTHRVLKMQKSRGVRHLESTIYIQFDVDNGIIGETQYNG